MKINTFTTNNYQAQTNKSFSPNFNQKTQAINQSNYTSVPSEYYQSMFTANQSMSKVSFKGLTKEVKMQELKKNLTKICEETIKKYNNHEESISQNLFTRGFIHHSFDFTFIDGDDFHNVEDPFEHAQWGSYMTLKHKMANHGKSLGEYYSQKMQDSISSWNQKFIDIISKEKQKGDNNLLDELLSSEGNLEQIKNLLNIK